MRETGQIALISNVRSHQNRRDMAAVRAAAARPEIAHMEIDGIDDVTDVLRELAGRGVGLVAVNGGDGTVQAVLSAILNEAPFEPLPRLAVLPGGMTNLIAHDVGLKGGREESIDRLARAVRDGHGTELSRSVLSLRLAPGEAPIHGFFLGAAAFHRAVLFSRQNVQSIGLDRSMAFFSSLSLIVLRALFGGSGRDDLFRGDKMAIHVDGVEDGPVRDRLIFLATTLASLPFGLRPFWGEGCAPCRYTYIDAPPKRLPAALLPVLRGRPRNWMAGNGYHSGRADEIELRLSGPLVLDGQIFTPGPDSPATLRAERDIIFFRC